MKKAFVTAGIVLIVVFASVYLFIPSRLIIREAGSAQCSFAATKRFIFEERNHSAWKSTGSSDSLQPEDDKWNYRVTNTFYTKTDIIIACGDDSYNTVIQLIPYNVDSTGIIWSDTVYTGNNPFSRINEYIRARRLKQHMATNAERLLTFLNDKEKIYSINIVKEQLKDIPLIARLVMLDSEPTPADAYKLIESVKQYAGSLGDSAVGPAMKYAAPVDSVKHQLMVAIPTSRLLKSSGEFMAKGLVGGNLIATEVRGGEATIRAAWTGMELFKEDYKLSSPAVPFEMMITDRSVEPDTAKWVTRIYYPIRF